MVNALALMQTDAPNVAAGGLIAALGTGVMLVGLVFGLLIIASLWKIFTKAGKPGWAAIVPIYNIIVLLEIVNKPLWWIVLFFIPLVTLTLSGLSPDRIPAASGLSNFLRITAGAFGTSISTTLWEDRSVLHHARLAEAINGSSATTAQYIQGMQASGFTHEQALASINRTIDVLAERQVGGRFAGLREAEAGRAPQPDSFEQEVGSPVLVLGGLPDPLLEPFRIGTGRVAL